MNSVRGPAPLLGCASLLTGICGWMLSLKSLRKVELCEDASLIKAG